MVRHASRSAFTLIELLVVIAIIAVLSVVVVLSLNPAELLRQSRDANRLSDLSTLNSALALYTTDQAGIAGFSLGNASSVYISLPDSSSTCGTWNLPTLPAGYNYACTASTSSRNINNSGWIPVNFGAISGGAPFSNLPLDGVNQSSTGLYYTYYSNGSQFIVTAIPESQKQKAAYGAKSIIQNYPDVLANGSNLAMSPLFNGNGLVGYWPIDEGTGSTTADVSGSGNAGAWSGTAVGSGGTYYTSGKVGLYAGIFDTNSSDGITAATTTSYAYNTLSFSGWFTSANTANHGEIAAKGANVYGNNAGWSISRNRSGLNPPNILRFRVCDGTNCGDITSPTSIADGSWHHFGAVIDKANTNYIYLYLDGQMVASTSISGLGTVYSNSYQLGIGYDTNTSGNPANFWQGNIDDVRLYSRALSAAEIQALYNAEK